MKGACYYARVLLLPMLFLLNQNLYAQTNLCDSVPGDWNWFTGKVVTIRSDGTVVRHPGNDGTWQCTDASRGEFMIIWRIGGYINKMALSADNNNLSSIDPSQSFVKATRIPPAPSTQSEIRPTPPAQSETPQAPPAQGESPVYNISPEDSKELARLMKRMSGDYTYTKQIHWPDGSVHDDGYIVATMSLTLNNDFYIGSEITEVHRVQSRMANRRICDFFQYAARLRLKSSWLEMGRRKRNCSAW